MVACGGDLAGAKAPPPRLILFTGLKARAVSVSLP